MKAAPRGARPLISDDNVQAHPPRTQLAGAGSVPEGNTNPAGSESRQAADYTPEKATVPAGGACHARASLLRGAVDLPQGQSYTGSAAAETLAQAGREQETEDAASGASHSEPAADAETVSPSSTTVAGREARLAARHDGGGESPGVDMAQQQHAAAAFSTPPCLSGDDRCGMQAMGSAWDTLAWRAEPHMGEAVTWSNLATAILSLAPPSWAAFPDQGEAVGGRGGGAAESGEQQQTQAPDGSPAAGEAVSQPRHEDGRRRSMTVSERMAKARAAAAAARARKRAVKEARQQAGRGTVSSGSQGVADAAAAVAGGRTGEALEASQCGAEAQRPAAHSEGGGSLECVSGETETHTVRHATRPKRRRAERRDDDSFLSGELLNVFYGHVVKSDLGW